jgi:hypothetical protein
MAIQMRRGAYAQFDPSKMKAGEWAVSTDSDTKKQQIWMCFAPGIVKRMGTVEDFNIEIQRLIQDYLDGIAESVSQAQKSAQTATEKATSASNSASQAQKSAQTATEKATSASNSASQAQKSAQTATEKATSASNSASQAQKSAQKAEQQAGLVEQKANGRGITFSVTSAGLLNVSKED